MIDATGALRIYAQGIRRLSNAASASLFVPSRGGGLVRATLIHEGEAPWSPELASLEAAAAFDARSRLSGQPPQTLQSELREAVLIPLPASRPAWAPDLLKGKAASDGEATAKRRKADHEPHSSEFDRAGWLGLRFSVDNVPARPEKFSLSSLPLELSGREDSVWGWSLLLTLGGALASHTALRDTDPMTGLPGRRSFQALLAEELHKASAENRSLSTLLVNPDGFVAVNERAGREEGDEVVREAVARLRGVLRSSDIVARYGGVTHSVLLLDTSVAAAAEVAEKVLRALSAKPFLSGSVPLGFSVGVAGLDPGTERVRDPLDLLHRADQALNAAKRSGGGRVVVWEKDLEAGEVGQFDRLAGIFTGEISRDYRNMTLLWDAVNVMATSEDFELLATEIAGKLYAAFALDRVGFFGASQTGELRLLSGFTREAAGSHPREGFELGAAEQAFLERGRREKRALDAVLPAEEAGGSGKTHAWFGPFLARDRLLGGLYLGRTVALDSSDIVFLRALASQLAMGLDRMLLSEQEKGRLEQDRLRLRAERDALQEALQRAKLEYRSAEMERVVSTARRVAPTDATVLIMGESGTGKELLARSIHELSPRHNRPFVVVDCGAIAASLADSELFGRERGAYTGAEERRAGRLVEADGGTVLLDEIGELPLEVQTKLLRFAQEKQVTAVGGTKPQRVDVRILAATNRDLGAEVAAGRFRADLYHRLNVVRLIVPPLRERPDDILYLAVHFLKTFSTLHGKKVRRLTPEGEALLLRDDWRGNVRELQNRLMQAVILCEGEELGPAELGRISAESPESAGEKAVSARAGGSVSGGSDLLEFPPGRAAPGKPDEPDPEEVTKRLRVALAGEVDAALSSRTPTGWPLGTWLAEDLVLEANAAAGGVPRRGARVAGIPETTFRRLLRSASDRAEAGLSPRPAAWAQVRRALRDLVRLSEANEDDLVDYAERILLSEILIRVGGNERTGAALLGVSVPTFRLRTEPLKAAP